MIERELRRGEVDRRLVARRREVDRASTPDRGTAWRRYARLLDDLVRRHAR